MFSLLIKEKNWPPRSLPSDLGMEVDWGCLLDLNHIYITQEAVAFIELLSALQMYMLMLNCTYLKNILLY